ncbi:hypothetical protein TNCV_3840941 [Trichonephila clavipes]|nr:hypothetical protein TNCV_3840941 [Trichonephila clavipes]
MKCVRKYMLQIVIVETTDMRAATACKDLLNSVGDSDIVIAEGSTPLDSASKVHRVSLKMSPVARYKAG